MAWSYANWVTQPDRATRITYLRAHISEVGGAITNRMSVESLATDSASLVDYHAKLLDSLRMEDPDNSGGAISASKRAQAAFIRGQPI